MDISELFSIYQISLETALIEGYYESLDEKIFSYDTLLIYMIQVIEYNYISNIFDMHPEIQVNEDPDELLEILLSHLMKDFKNEFEKQKKFYDDENEAFQATADIMGNEISEIFKIKDDY